ncbi:hypothetical protein [Flavobacterium pallidum]|uniref:Uncharacterized protein n=1 Tax=Flavobacterium pallidum TaxID=2172098 RepID=A0A2S1SKI3_9FLAO|nr:hypothetical protein [Flavobacterium pallidum]AWI26920.1 hypothetical protein HYN49_13960 [Flavobacterium pallidum]
MQRIFTFFILFLSCCLASAQDVNSINLCEQTITFADGIKVNPEFQSISADNFLLSWMYIENHPGEKANVRLNENGEIIYRSGNKLTEIIKSGFDIEKRQQDQVSFKDITVIVLGKPLAGNSVTIKRDNELICYLIAAGNICGRDMLFQARLGKEPVSNDVLPEALKKVITLGKE